MTLPPAAERIHADAEDVLPEFLVERLGGGPGAQTLVSFMFLLDFDDRLAADLAIIGGTLKIAYRIIASGKATSQKERELVSKAVRLLAALLDDGPDTYVARKLADEGEERANLEGISNRTAMFSLAEGIFRKNLPFAFKLASNPGVFGVHPEDADLLLRDVRELGRVLAAEPKRHDKDELFAHLQQVAHEDAEKTLMAASILSWGEAAFDGDMTNIDALREALEQLGDRLMHLRMEES